MQDGGEGYVRSGGKGAIIGHFRPYANRSDRAAFFPLLVSLSGYNYRAIPGTYTYWVTKLESIRQRIK